MKWIIKWWIMWVMWCNSYRAILRNEKYWMSEYMFWYLWIITLLIIPSLLFFFCAKKERTKNLFLVKKNKKLWTRCILKQSTSSTKKKNKVLPFNSIQFNPIYLFCLTEFFFVWLEFLSSPNICRNILFKYQ